MTQRHLTCARADHMRKFASLALSIAVATTLAGGSKALAHDGDILRPEVFPIGDSGLLPDTETDPTKDGVVGPLLPCTR